MKKLIYILLFVVIGGILFSTIDFSESTEKIIPSEALKYKLSGDSKSGIEAIEDYTQAINIYSDYDTAYLRIGYEWILLKYYELAFDNFDKAIEINPKYARAYYLRALAMRRCNYKTANIISDYKQAIKLDNEFLDSYIMLAITYCEISDTTKAIKIYKEGMKVFQEYTNINYTTDLRTLAEYKAAAENYTEDRGYILFLNLASMLQAKKKYNDAIEVYSNAIQYYPYDGKLYYKRSYLLHLLEEKVKGKNDLKMSAALGYDDAIKTLAKIIKDDQKMIRKMVDDLGISENYNKIIRRDTLKASQTAIAKYKAEIARDSNNLDTYINLAATLSELEDNIGAIEVYKSGYIACRDNPDALYYLNYANTLTRLNRYEEAKKILTDGVNQFPENSNLLYNRAIANLLLVDIISAFFDFSDCQMLKNENAPKALNFIFSYFPEELSPLTDMQ